MAKVKTKRRATVRHTKSGKTVQVRETQATVDKKAEKDALVGALAKQIAASKKKPKAAPKAASAKAPKAKVRVKPAAKPSVKPAPKKAAKAPAPVKPAPKRIAAKPAPKGKAQAEPAKKPKKAAAPTVTDSKRKPAVTSQASGKIGEAIARLKELEADAGERLEGRDYFSGITSYADRDGGTFADALADAYYSMEVPLTDVLDDATLDRYMWMDHGGNPHMREFVAEAVARGIDTEAKATKYIKEKLSWIKKVAPTKAPGPSAAELRRKADAEHARKLSEASRQSFVNTVPKQPKPAAEAKRLMDRYGFTTVALAPKDAAKRERITEALEQSCGLLAHALGVDPKVLSLGGKIGLEFTTDLVKDNKGRKAGAQYNPHKRLVQLGGKSNFTSPFAHEWGHALDHYISSFTGMASDRVGDAKKGAHKAVHDLMEMLDGSEYKAQCERLTSDFDGRRMDVGYYDTPTEMFARCMETYVWDKLAAKGIDPMELGTVQIVSHAADPALTRHRQDSTFPDGPERKAINKHFDALFAALAKDLKGELRKSWVAIHELIRCCDPTADAITALNAAIAATR